MFEIDDMEFVKVDLFYVLDVLFWVGNDELGNVFISWMFIMLDILLL